MSRLILMALAALSFATTAVAQDGPYLYATYFECDPATVASVDAGREGLNNALNAHVDAGRIVGWGWSGHHTGGTWDRVGYFIAPTLDAVLTFQDSWQTEVGRDHAAARDALRRACPEHVDYIWHQLAASQSGERVGARAPASYSTYFGCDRSRLDRADEIVRGSAATALNAMVADGSLSAWRWHGHVLGGNFARLLVLDAPTHADVIRANNRLGEDMDAEDLAELTDICGNHQDYLWVVSASR
jgi:hypothetical protein